MTTITINGVTLSANATLNGFPRLASGRDAPSRYHPSASAYKARQRRLERVFVRSMKTAMVEALS